MKIKSILLLLFLSVMAYGQCPTPSTNPNSYSWTCGQVYTGTINFTGAISSGITGVWAAANGGTGQPLYAVGDMLYASGTTTLSRLAGVATGNALISGGVNTAPSWGKIGVGTHISGFGTGVATALSVNTGSAGAVVLFNGAGGAPSSITLTNATGLPLNTGVTGTLPVTNGGTGFGTINTGEILYASASNTISKLAVGTNGDVLTLAAGVPSWAAPATASGWLTIVEQSTSITGVEGNYYYYDATADSDTLTLPGSPTDDDLIGVYLETTSGANVIVINRNGNTIAGLTSNVTLFIAADFVILQFINGDWSIVSNGIQRHCGSVSRDAAQSIGNDAFRTIAWDTEESDFGGILSITDDRFIPRRSSYYDISMEGDITLESAVAFISALNKNGVLYKRADHFTGTASNQSFHMEWTNLALTTTDTIVWRVYQDGTAAQNTLTGTQKFRATVCEK